MDHRETLPRRGISRREMMKRVARFTNVIPVDADSNLETAMKAGAAGLRLGKVLLLFPEGERSIDGELKPFRKGASILSAHLNAPIVPVAMDGLFELWTPASGQRTPGADRVWNADYGHARQVC